MNRDSLARHTGVTFLRYALVSSLLIARSVTGEPGDFLVTALPRGQKSSPSEPAAEDTSPMIDRHPIVGFLIAFVCIGLGVALGGAAISGCYGRTLTCERVSGHASCRVMAGFLGHQHQIAFVPWATARIKLVRHVVQGGVSSSEGGVNQGALDIYDIYDIALAPASGSLRTDDHFEFLLVSSGGSSDPVGLLKSFLADPEQRSFTLVLKRAERFDLPSLGCFGAFVVLCLVLGGGP